jgi:hypothetical protein
MDTQVFLRAHEIFHSNVFEMEKPGWLTLVSRILFSTFQIQKMIPQQGRAATILFATRQLCLLLAQRELLYR